MEEILLNIHVTKVFMNRDEYNTKNVTKYITDVPTQSNTTPNTQNMGIKSLIRSLAS